MNIDFSGRTAIVTGAAHGFGRAIAIAFAKRRANVWACDVLGDELLETRRLILSLGGTCSARSVDVRDKDAVEEFAGDASAETGHVDILVNNAGGAWGEPLATFPEGAWDKVLALNLKAPFFCTRAFLELLERRAGQDDPSRIINIGSIDGLRVAGLPTYSYSASKAGIHQLTKVLAAELGPRWITVNAIAPGPFESKMMAATLEQFGEMIAAAAPLRRIGRPDDMAGTAVYLSSRAGAYVTGAVIPVDGGIWAAT
jgi:NAD(P)-dependent dehydrogenase (short-subunit alcohol dehydrogenase family)